MLPLLPPVFALLAAQTLGWFETAERDVLQWVTCKLYAPWLDPILIQAQEKTVAIPFLVVTLVLLAFWRPHRALRAFLTCLIGIGLAMLLAEILWATVDRPRPPHVYEHLLTTPAEMASCADHPDALVVRKPISNSPSFPSRHALTIGVFVTALWLASRRVGVLAILYGTVAAVGRVYGAKHWPSDVIAGVVFGVAIGWLTWRLIPWLLDRVGKRDLVEVPSDETPDG
ncbi:MAG: phosphatase PAP2 family protein, partial [Planctomycetota bacterium]